MFHIILVILFVLGIFLCAIGLGRLLAPPNEFICDRQNNLCYWESSRIWSKQPRKRVVCMLSDIKEATMIRFDRFLSMPTYRIVLKLNNNSVIPLVYWGYDGKAYSEQVKQINRFLKYGPNKLSKKYSVFTSGILFVAFGIACIAWSIGFELMLLYLVRPH